jgi:protein-disulfide isomerase
VSTTPLDIPAYFTRRNLIILGAAALALVAIVVAYFWISGNGEIAGGEPDTIPTSELMRAGPLGEQAMGAENAPVTVIEYASMTCPHCANFAVNVLPKVKAQYIDTGKVRFIFREFPFDPVASAAFMLARCADKDKYFPLIEALFQQQSKWAIPNKDPTEPLFSVVKQVGFTQASFKACLTNQTVLDGVEWVRNRATEKFKVNATPTFFINGKMHRGEMSFEEIDKEIQSHLKA